MQSTTIDDFRYFKLNVILSTLSYHHHHYHHKIQYLPNYRKYNYTVI